MFVIRTSEIGLRVYALNNLYINKCAYKIEM